MKKIISLLVFCMAFLVTTNSALAWKPAPYTPGFALLESWEGMSIPHPEILKKNNPSGKAVRIIAMLNPGLLGVEGVEDSLVLPVIAKTKSGYIQAAFAFYKGMDPFGIQLLEIWFKGSVNELADAKMLVFDKEGRRAYTLNGLSVGNLRTENNLKYEPKKFDTDEAYRSEIFDKFGIMPRGMSAAWTEFYSKNLPDVDIECFREYDVADSKVFETLEDYFLKDFQEYSTPHGTRLSKLVDIADFKREYKATGGYTVKQRLMSQQISLPITPDPASLGISAALTIIFNVIPSVVDSERKGFYNDAVVEERIQMADPIVRMVRAYRERLDERTNEIAKLNLRLIELETELQKAKQAKR